MRSPKSNGCVGGGEVRLHYARISWRLPACGAAWDALAIAAGWPLATLLGSTPKRVPAYNSCGLGLMSPDRLADEAEKLLAGGFRAVKLRLGYPTLTEDLIALHAVKKRVGGEIAVMVDYNQALSLAQALERG